MSIPHHIHNSARDERNIIALTTFAQSMMRLKAGFHVQMERCVVLRYHDSYSILSVSNRMSGTLFNTVIPERVVLELLVAE